MLRRLGAMCAVLVAVLVIGIVGCDIGSSDVDVTVYPPNSSVQYEVSQ